MARLGLFSKLISWHFWHSFEKSSPLERFEWVLLGSPLFFEGNVSEQDVLQLLQRILVTLLVCELALAVNIDTIHELLLISKTHLLVRSHVAVLHEFFFQQLVGGILDLEVSLLEQLELGVFLDGFQESILFGRAGILTLNDWLADCFLSSFALGLVFF